MNSPRRSRIENAASLAEIISAVAVVISLVYVASEIQQNTRALQESNAQVVLTLGHSWSDWFRDESFAAAAVVAYEDPSEMRAVQERQVSAWIGRGLDVWESAFSSRQEGLMTDELFDVRDMHVLVSGASRGIGRAIAEGFVARGARVVITGRAADTLEAAAATMEGEHSVQWVVCDVGDRDAIPGCVE